jgi:hypothetical protein
MIQDRNIEKKYEGAEGRELRLKLSKRNTIK